MALEDILGLLVFPLNLTPPVLSALVDVKQFLIQRGAFVLALLEQLLRLPVPDLFTL